MYPHFLLVTFPAQGHINPALEFAKRLARLGSRVTFVTSTFAYRQMTKFNREAGAGSNISFATYSDGYDDGRPESVPPRLYMEEIRRHSSIALPEIIGSCADEGRRVTFVVYSLLLPWIASVARELDLPSALLWIQPAALLAIYYHYFNEDFGDNFEKVLEGRSGSVELPGLPRLAKSDLPSHLITTKFALSAFKEHLRELGDEASPRVLINSFDALEPEALDALKGFTETITVGPLVPRRYLTEINDNENDTTPGFDLFENSSREKYVKFLNSNAKHSVVYISFGSTSVLPNTQVEEIVNGLLNSPFTFMWVLREYNNSDGPFAEKLEELEKRGVLVPWCSQMEVLSHPSIGCFLTHCGWNSMAESLSCGVPVVAFPQWADQPTNAKLAEDVWGIGVRMRPNAEGVVEAEEVGKCLKMVMGGENEGMVKSAMRWKEAVRAAASSGGSSDVSLKRFVEKIRGVC
uniref:Glycosyltransferase n=1 Tax=Kalanchoe fedtschenkoi TaxID=63787 RepID=A0A7N0RDP9_KALFE